jgi:hypothetical protein
MADIVERLREQAELVPAVPRAPWKAMAEAADEITRLRAQVAALEGDAGRYRWLREHVSGHRAVSSARPATFAFPGPMVLTPLGDIMRGSVAQHLDAAIDAALAARKGVV